MVAAPPERGVLLTASPGAGVPPKDGVPSDVVVPPETSPGAGVPVVVVAPEVVGAPALLSLIHI